MTVSKQNGMIDSFKGFSRRDFVKYLLAGSALSLSALNKLNGMH